MISRSQVIKKIAGRRTPIFCDQDRQRSQKCVSISSQTIAERFAISDPRSSAITWLYLSLEMSTRLSVKRVCPTIIVFCQKTAQEEGKNTGEETVAVQERKCIKVALPLHAIHSSRLEPTVIKRLQTTKSYKSKVKLFVGICYRRPCFFSNENKFAWSDTMATVMTTWKRSCRRSCRPSCIKQNTYF